jgi:hypothetical protein
MNQPNQSHPTSTDLPAASEVSGGKCARLPATAWQRTGYSSDSSYPNATYPHDGIASNDLQWFLARGFHGSISPSSASSLQPNVRPDGNELPTYMSANTNQGGTQGQNIASGMYCGSSSVTATTCGTSTNIGGTYFFARNQPGFHDVCPQPDPFANGQVGCRDAAVIIFENPEVAGASGFTSTDKQPDRVTVATIYNFRFYCDHDGNGYCDSAPKSVIGSATNAQVWGRFVAPNDPSIQCPPDCAPPSLYGDTASLSQ